MTMTKTINITVSRPQCRESWTHLSCPAECGIMISGTVWELSRTHHHVYW